VTEPNDQLERLEEKLLRAIDVFKRTQEEKRALEQEIETLKTESKEHALEQEIEKLRAESLERAEAAKAMERELDALRKEREDVRSRVEKLLERIDGLTGPLSEG
jgi:predicted  nucleic acid-binding Zn-ribbon protein